MATDQELPLFQVHDEPESIRAVANTITSSFADDPLIRWLRPLAGPWSASDPNTSKWQYRRVLRAAADGIVLSSATVTEVDREFHKDGKVCERLTVEWDAGAVALLFPPRRRCRWTLGRILLRWKVWFLDIVSSVHEKGGNDKRVKQLMDAHERVVTNVQDTYRIPDLWYLEVIAVHPCLQGRGLGRKALHSVLDHTNDEPVILECTNGDNVAFYERLGFKVIEEVELVEDGAGVKLWFMLRQGLRKQTD
ncbi:hypothetical protein CNMCM5878_004213 [Aspergillus fumigatiaffinis]|nr:hypothetical protein CNMCM5878_004213 [Aspergillus fumigatiaffinis]